MSAPRHEDRAALLGWLDRRWIALGTRRCRGCDDKSVHTHHLTWLGKRRYTR